MTYDKKRLKKLLKMDTYLFISFVKTHIILYSIVNRNMDMSFIEGEVTFNVYGEGFYYR